MKTKLLLLLLLANFSIYAQTNLVPNGNFETWTYSSQPDNWFRFLSGYASQSTDAQSGSSSTNMMIASGTFNYINSEYFAVQANKTYRITLYHKTVSGTFSSIDFSVYHKPGTFKEEIAKKSEVVFSTTEWKKLEFEYTSTADENIEIDVWTNGALNSEILIDNVSVVDVATIPLQYTKIPDENFEKRLIALKIDSGTPDGQVLTSSINTVETLDVSSKSITDLTGIEDFTALKELNCNYNEITNLNVSKNTQLTSLNLRSNKLTVLNISKNTLLNNLDASYNSLTALDLSANTKLTGLSCDSNKLTALDVSHLNLEGLNCSYNYSITSLDLSKSTNLTYLNCKANRLTSLEVSKALALDAIDCSSNVLQTVDVSKNTKLTLLDCSSNKLKSLDVTSNLALQYLSCGNNGGSNEISTIDLSQNINLIEFQARGISLTSIDLRKNTALKQLDLQSNALTELDLSMNAELVIALASSNKLTTIDITKITKLEALTLNNNKLTSVDASKNTALKMLNTSENNLSSLNLKNGNNSNFVKNYRVSFMTPNGRMGLDYFSSFKNNINLACIQVDDVANAKINMETLKDLETYFSTLDCSISTSISDPAFEDKLIDLKIDTDGKNGGVLNASIAGITSLDISGSSITDLTGIQGFTALTNLNISGNLFTKVDLSKNAALNTLNASNNPTLTCIQVADVDAASKWTVSKDATASFSLDCTVYTLIPDPNFENFLIEKQIDRDGKNGKVKTESISGINYYLDMSGQKISDLTGIQDFTALAQLSVANNNLTSIDVSKNLALNHLNVSSNQLTDVDVSKNTTLRSLNIGYNKITNADFSSNINLTTLQIDSNKFVTLDISTNTKLSYLTVYGNQLITLDVSANTALEQIRCQNNQLRSLDLSKNPKLIQVFVTGNKLVNLNLQNGKNTLITKGSSDFTQNPDLTCIQVDDIVYSNDIWAAMKDATATYSSNACPTVVSYTAIPDPKFEDKLIDLKIDTDGKNGKVATSNIIALTNLNVSNSGITDLTGIEDFIALTSLECNKNALTTLDISRNLSLTKVNVSENKLSELYVSVNQDLSELNCNNNEIATLNVAKNTKLTILNASFNKIKSLDVSKNTILKEFDCAGNDLYNLNVKNGNNANMQKMIYGNFTENPHLLCIEVDDAAFSTKNWIAKDATANYSTEACAANYQYTSIPDPNFEGRLISLGLDSGAIDGRVLTSNISNVKYLYAYGDNKITDLTGIEDFASLETLYCYNEALTKIDLTKNTKLKDLDISSNKISTLDLSQNKALTSLNCSYNSLADLNISNNLALTTLKCNSNSLTNLNISGNLALKTLDCGSNNLTTFDISDNLALTSLIINFNKLTSFDASENVGLEQLYIGANQLTTINLSANLALKELGIFDNKIVNIDLAKNSNLTLLSAGSNELSGVDVSQNTALKKLYISNFSFTTIDVSQNTLLSEVQIYNGKLETLDLSHNTELTSLNVYSNQLTSLNLQNGKNSLLKKEKVSFISNPKLYCILVDDVTYANDNWSTRKDAIATFNTECTGEVNLPSNNFAIETKAESCLGENNGEINITTQAAFDYVAKINNVTYNFNGSLNVANLAPGNYKINITIANMVFEQNFSATIAKGGTIAGKSSVTSKKVNVEITEGTAPFTVSVDGTEQFQTTDTNFSLNLATGGLVEVATAKACEGVFSKKVSSFELGTVLAAYPNPTSGSFEIEIPTQQNEVKIELYNFAGQLISSKNYTLENGKAVLNLENQASGIYSAKVYLETPEYLKIIKN